MAYKQNLKSDLKNEYTLSMNDEVCDLHSYEKLLNCIGKGEQTETNSDRDRHLEETF